MANIMRLGGGSGGGLEIAVVGGTTQPVSPKDNTVWVNTDVEIGAVTFSPNAPESHAVGDVWVNTSSKNTNTGLSANANILTVSESPFLEINILNVHQWDGSSWVNKGGSAIYANETWTTMALYLVNYGVVDENYPITVGGATSASSHVSASGASYSVQSDHLRLVKGGSNSYIVLQFNKLINIAKYNKLTAIFTPETPGSTMNQVRIGFGIDTIASGVTWHGIVGYGGNTVTAAANGQQYTLAVDLSNYSVTEGKAGIEYNFSGTSAASALKIYYFCLTA